MKHVGKMKNNSARLAVVYRTLPNDATNALVVGTQGLPDSHHDSLMSLIESDSGQQAYELAEVLATRRFPDGSVMLAYLHTNGHLKKVPTNMVLMTPNSVTQVPLDQLNELIAKDRGVSVSELALREDGSLKESEKQDTKSIVPPADSQENKKLVEDAPYHPGYEGAVVQPNEPVTAADLRSMAEKLFKEAQALRRKAEEMEPPKPKKTQSSKKTKSVDEQV